MRRLSIRMRLTLWYAGVLLAGMAALGVGTWFALYHRVLNELDQRLVEALEGVRATFDGEPSELLVHEMAEVARAAPEVSFSIRDPQGRVLRYGPAAAPGTFRGKQASVPCTFTRAGTCGVEVAISLEHTRVILRDFAKLLGMMVPGALLVASLGGYWISRRALKPVDEITRAARSITVHNLSQRLPKTATGDEIQRLSEAWNEVLERLDSSVQRIRQFTADASHELRTPLSLIRATAELALRRDRPAEDYRRSLRSVLEESDRMSGLTESLLALARADANGLELALSALDLRVLVQEVVKQSGSLAELRHVKLHLHLDGGGWVIGNEAALRRVLLILVDNALAHTPEGGLVTVSVASRGRQVRLAVEDTGAGIAPEVLPHIFERFYRADPSRNRAGAGLGLSIAQAIAQAHDSRIEVESSPGQGSCFHLDLPGSSRA